MARQFSTKAPMTRPIRSVLSMLVFLGVVGMTGFLLYQPIREVFGANPYINGLIVVVFLIGVAYAFWQVASLFRAVDWMEAFIEDRSGLETINPPRLLASMAAMLRERESRRRLGASTARVILDSVAQRLDESRDILRYVGSLLVFLGLLGTFWGLSLTVPAVVETISALDPSGPEGSEGVFNRFMSGLREQLGGLGTAFASSLLGLAGSLIVGFLEILAGHAQNRFYRELEESLSNISHVSVGGDEGFGLLGPLVERNIETMEQLAGVLLDGEAARADAARRLDKAAQDLASVAARMMADEAAILRLAASQDALQATLAQAVARNEGVIGGMDEATRTHIRSMDAQLLRLTEEVAAGRQDAVGELRGELKLLARAMGQNGASGRAAGAEQR